MLAILKQRKENPEKNLTRFVSLGFILHFFSLSFSDLPLEGAQLPAVPVLQAGVFSHPPPRRQLGPATDFGRFWVHLGVQGSFKKRSSDSLNRVGTLKALHFRTGISETPMKVFSFSIFPLFQKGTAGVNHDGSQGLGDCISRSLTVRPSKHICPYGSNSLEYWKPELPENPEQMFSLI